MVTRKNFGKSLGKAVKSIGKASPQKIDKYVARAANNISRGGASLAGAAMAAKSGDYRGAAQGVIGAANHVIGKKNIVAGKQVILGKKGMEKMSGVMKKIGRAEKAVDQYSKGDIAGATKTALGKKAYEKGIGVDLNHDGRIDHHIARAKHHTDQLQALHTATTGRIPAPIGGGSIRPR